MKSKAPRNHLAALTIRAPEPPKVPQDPGKYGEYIDAYRMYVQEVESIRSRVTSKPSQVAKPEVVVEEGKELPHLSASMKVGDVGVGPQLEEVEIVATDSWMTSVDKTHRAPEGAIEYSVAGPGIGPHILKRREDKHAYIAPIGVGLDEISWDKKVKGLSARLRTGYSLAPHNRVGAAEIILPGSKSEPPAANPELTKSAGSRPKGSKSKGKSPPKTKAQTPAATVVTAGALAKRSTKVDASRSFASVAKQPVATHVAREEVARAAIKSMRVERKLGNATKAAGFGYAWARSGTLVLKKASGTGKPETLVFPRKRLGGDRSINPATAKAGPAKGTPLKST